MTSSCARARFTVSIATTPEGRLEVAADLVIGADGRHSTVRERAGLSVDEFGAPIDVLWFRLSRGEDERAATAGYVSDGHILVMLNRGSYWQCGLVIAKGTFGRMRAAGLPALRERIARLAPACGRKRARTGRLGCGQIANRTGRPPAAVVSARSVVHRRRGARDVAGWRSRHQPGHSGCRRDEQPARASAAFGAPSDSPRCNDLQRRRELPTRMTQRFQIEIHKRVIARVLASAGDGGTLPWPLRQLRRYPPLRRIPARLLGVGFRPEHVARQPP